MLTGKINVQYIKEHCDYNTYNMQRFTGKKVPQIYISTVYTFKNMRIGIVDMDQQCTTLTFDHVCAYILI